MLSWIIYQAIHLNQLMPGKFAGGEMALATEQGNLIGDRIERILK